MHTFWLYTTKLNIIYANFFITYNNNKINYNVILYNQKFLLSTHYKFRNENVFLNYMLQVRENVL